MRIEINSGGLGAFAISEYQSNLSSFLSDAERVISSFKTVESATYDLNGGVGTLQDTVGELSARIQREEAKLEAAVETRRKSNDFVDLAVRVDAQVAVLVNKNKDEFYRVHPWLRPPTDVSAEAPFYARAWSWLCGRSEAVVEDLNSAWEWARDTAKKAWNGLVEFYHENKKIIDTVLIVVGAVAAIAAVIASGGGALIFLLGALGCSAGAAAAISGAIAVIAVVTTLASSTLNIIDIWAEVDDPAFQSWKRGLTIASAASNLLYSVGGIYNSLHHISPAQAKQAMQSVFSEGRGAYVNKKYVPFLSDYQPSADSQIHRELLGPKSHNHFYSFDNPNGGKVITCVDPCTDSGVRNVIGNSKEEYIVLSGTHGNRSGGLGFGGQPPALKFYQEDLASFADMPNVRVINVQNHIVSLDASGMPQVYNRPFFENLFKSGKNIVCAWCYSERSALVHTALGLA